MIDHLDRIQNLGFTIEIVWNTTFIISYENPNWGTSLNQNFGFKILSCNYFTRPDFSFEDLVETCCDFFYMWYNKNLQLLNRYESDNSDVNYDTIVDSIIGDITKQVYRHNSLDQLFD